MLDHHTLLTIVQTIQRRTSWNGKDDLEDIINAIRQHAEQGFTLEESIDLCCLMEEVNPTLDEDTALAKAKQINEVRIHRVGEQKKNFYRKPDEATLAVSKALTHQQAQINLLLSKLGMARACLKHVREAINYSEVSCLTLDIDKVLEQIGE